MRRRGCVLALSADSARRAPAVLDVGTGSGVLAIAAARLGAASALGIDHDPDALVAARESVDANGETRDRHARYPSTFPATAAILGAPFDVVVANLTGGLLIARSGALADATARDGHFIASGFMTDEEDAVTEVFDAPAPRADRSAEEEWWLRPTLHQPQWRPEGRQGDRRDQLRPEGRGPRRHSADAARGGHANLVRRPAALRTDETHRSRAVRPWMRAGQQGPAAVDDTRPPDSGSASMTRTS